MDCLREFDDCLPLLQALDKDPSPLQKHFEKLKSGRLGLRFEHFIAYWLIISPNFEPLTQNLQIIEKMKKGSHTHGELDFIIRNIHTNQVIHMEVAVKFYLGCEDFNDPYRWFGTNTQDQLGRKVAHLKQHQTQLSNKFDSYLKNLGYHIDKQACFLKGRLFYPQGIDTPPEGVCHNHLRGRWIQSPEESNNDLFYPLDKKDWLAELKIADLEKETITAGLSKAEKTQCYAKLTQDYKEIDRVFYLADSFTFPENKEKKQ